MARSNALLRLSAVMLVIAVIVRPGDGLRCYKCASDSDPNCETNPKEIENCDELGDFTKISVGLPDVRPACIKAVVKDTEHGGRQLVFRNCILDTSMLRSCDIAGKMSLPLKAEVTFCETCLGDLCNNSNRFAISFMSLLLPCIITLILSPIH